ncbi:MAG: hypothetical protein KJ655_02150 [Candidatus Thermoplasmatota archaeon]|nr:hypothetical protein [Candidatus Thermoplasmatota archaeon]
MNEVKKIFLLGLIMVCILSAGCIDWGGGGTEKETPTAHAVVTYSEGEYHVVITSISEPVTVSAVMYIVKDANGNDVRYGYVEDIYSKDVNGVMFHDNVDAKLSVDDVFIIKGDDGPGESGGRFVLKHTTGKTILNIPLKE